LTAKLVGDKNIAASVKTTKNSNVSSWITTNSKHLKDLEKARNTGVVRQANNSVPVDQIELHIFIPDSNYSSSVAKAWEDAIKLEYPDIDKVIISTMEKAVGI